MFPAEKSGDVLFYDGITFAATGELLTDRRVSDTKKIKDTKKRIAKFVKQVDTLNTIPMPSGGDCWMCSMSKIDGDNDHLESHIEENYLHGSLIFNALQAKGYKSPGVIMQMKCKESIKRALRTYLTKKLLPGLCVN